MTMNGIIPLVLVTAVMLAVPSDALAQRREPTAITTILPKIRGSGDPMDPSDRHPRCRAHHAWRDMLIYTTVGFVAVMLIPGDDDHAQWVAAGAGLVVGGTFGGLRDRHECREWKRILARTKPAT